MNYGLTESLRITPNQCLVLGLYEDKKLPSIQNLSTETATLLSNRLEEAGDWVWHTGDNGADLLLMHCGKNESFNGCRLKKRLAEIISILQKQRTKTAVFALPQMPNQTADWQVSQMVLTVDTLLYSFPDYKSKNIKPVFMQTVDFYLNDATDKAIHKAKAIAEGVELTKKLADCPANICTPSYLAEAAKNLASKHSSIQTTVLSEASLKELGMGALLAVGQGSCNPPCFIELHYQGGDKNAAPLVLVGKGITFDSGGISIKPSNSMEEMKYDMAGAASVLGALHAAAALKLPINIIGLIPSAENMPSGTATRPGDVVTSLSGQTIEILNTDAEGRLILADALTYAERFNPQLVLDIATLTGAVLIALGTITTGFMTNDDEVAQWVEEAAAISHEKTWRLPLFEEYQEGLESPIADVANITNDRLAGSITAASFLSRFTEKYRWAHFDIAGTAWVSGKNRVATGRPVSLLVEIIQRLAHAR